MNELLIFGRESTLSRQAFEVAGLLGYSVAFASGDHNLEDLEPGVKVFVAFDDVSDKAATVATCESSRLINLVHPSASVSPTANLAHGIMIGANAVVGMNATLGNGVVLNALSSIEHDNVIGAYTFFGTGAILCGNVTTGDSAFIGAGATIQPGTTIGSHTTIGTGAVVLRDADPHCVYVGNPARKIKGP